MLGSDRGILQRFSQRMVVPNSDSTCHRKRGTGYLGSYLRRVRRAESKQSSELDIGFVSSPSASSQLRLDSLRRQPAKNPPTSGTFSFRRTLCTWVRQHRQLILLSRRLFSF